MCSTRRGSILLGGKTQLLGCVAPVTRGGQDAFFLATLFIQQIPRAFEFLRSLGRLVELPVDLSELIVCLSISWIETDRFLQFLRCLLRATDLGERLAQV